MRQRARRGSPISAVIQYPGVCGCRRDCNHVHHPHKARSGRNCCKLRPTAAAPLRDSMPPTPGAARGISPTPPSYFPQQISGSESNGKNKKKQQKKKSKKKRQRDITTSGNRHVAGAQHAVQPQRQQPHDSPASTSATAAHPAEPTSPPNKHKRVKEIPVRFAHPQLDSELRRLRRSWLSPGDPLFQLALDVSYRGVRHVPAAALPQAIHKGFRESFDGLHGAGLFMYDTVQAGGKRLSKTFVTRTLLGDPGITYKYLGLRLFAHPWDREGGDFRKGPGDGLADALNDPCLSDLFQRDAGVGGARGGSPSGAKKVVDTLRKVGELSEWMRLRAVALQEEERDGGGREGGSCAFNLTLINRMESSATKRDLKPDPLFAMGKCSVSWHADSCLQDFSTIGVYHCTDPVPAEPDWGIALRVSKEADAGVAGSGDSSDIDAARGGKAGRREGGVSAASGKPGSGKGAATVPEREEQEILTPPLLVPLQSGDAYFLLDDFNHFHEHAVVSGSSTLRYSSTHRVAATEGNTFSHVQKRCEEVLAGDGAAPEDDRILDLVQVRAEQALLTELESEWLNQFWVQGRRHAVLHPWWRGPMALVLATWRELERRTALTVQRLASLKDEEGQGLAGGAGGAAGMAEPVAIARAFETVLRVLEERRESRSRWASRFADPAYRSLPEDCSPVVPALWPAADSGGGGGEGKGGGDGGAGSALPRSLAGVISRLRECYTAVYRAASGGKKAGSAKAIAAGAASNWELFRAGSSAAASLSGRINGAPNHKNRRHQGGGGGSGGGDGGAGGKDGKKRPAGSSRVAGGRTGSGGAGGRGPKRKRPSKGREG